VFFWRGVFPRVWGVSLGEKVHLGVNKNIKKALFLKRGGGNFFLFIQKGGGKGGKLSPTFREKKKTPAHKICCNTRGENRVLAPKNY
jgi:hypothetical protein